MTEKHLRIFIVTSSGNLSGGTRQAVYHARGLLERGHDVKIFARPNAQARQLAPDLPWVDWANEFSAAKKNLEAQMSGKHPYIVHSYHNKANKLMSLIGLLWRVNRRPVVCIGHRGVTFHPNNPLPYWSPGLRAFTANSAHCAAILRRLTLGLKPVEIVYNAIPKERITPLRPARQIRAELNIPEDALVMGFVGSGHIIKGMQVLLPAFAAAKPPKTVFLAVGLYKSDWEPVLASLGLAEQVRIVEPTPDVADYLQVMDFFIIPSLSESQPNTLLEAMSMGLPAGGSSVGGIPDLIADSELLVPANNVAALSALISRLAGNEELRAKKSRDNLEIAKQFSLDVRLDKLETLYDRLLAKL